MSSQLLKINNDKIKSWMILFSTIIALYFWDFGAKYKLGIDTRYLTLLPLLFYLQKKTLYYKGLSTVLIINLYVIFTYIYNYLVYEKVYTLFDLKSFLGFSLTLFIALICKDIILQNQKKIIKFLFILTPLFFINSSFQLSNDLDLLWKCSYFNVIEDPIFKLFFLENSHFAMIAIPVFLLNLFYICKKFNLINFLLIVIFFVAMVIFQSTTMVVGMLVSLPITVFIAWNKNNTKFIFSCLMITLIYIIIFVNINGCSRKFSDLLTHGYIKALNITNESSKIENIKFISAEKYIFFYELLSETFNFSLKKVSQQDKDQYKDDEALSNSNKDDDEALLIEKEKLLFTVNISSQVLKNSYEVAISTVKEKPFGEGLNKFEDAFINQISSQKNNYTPDVMQINRNDGGSNFNKLLGEFGYVLIIIIIYLIIFIFSKKISIETKLFLFPIVITQMIRGAGYFNGGFLLSLALIILVIHGTKKEN